MRKTMTNNNADKFEVEKIIIIPTACQEERM
jgi:hypothetical protein